VARSRRAPRGRSRPKAPDANKPAAADLVELRVLEGPNLYFPRPAIKLTLTVPGWLRATSGRVERRSSDMDASGAAHAGAPASDQRRRFTARLAAHVARRIAGDARTRLAVRGRPGPEPDQVVVAFPWRRRGTAEALGREVAVVMRQALATRRAPARLFTEAARRVQAVPPGEGPFVPDPEIPVVAVTGTNGKTTTVRLLAHLVRTSGSSVAYSSTDGVYHDGRLVEAGDYSGFGGAAMAIGRPGVDVAILETARGGILLRGIGTAHNDVAVVTNVSSDHLGLHGIRTLDQLAEVKAAITRVTRPDGWVVLNADDPRVLAMRRGATGRIALFSGDAHHPAIREALADGGRAITVLDGFLSVLGPRGALDRLVALDEVPVTLAGIASHHVQNAMAATAAALGIGLSNAAVVEGLTTFVQSAESNPGRANVYTLGDRVVVVDYAHNEAGMVGFAEILAGLRRRGAAIWLAFCAAGDRQDDVLHALGYRAARGADHVVISELAHYLRGRDPSELLERLRAGATDGGAAEVPVVPDEVGALRLMLDRSGPADVVGLTALGQRPEVFALLEELGAVRADPATVRRLARLATGR
jgi:cyanophycin synthetase